MSHFFKKFIFVILSCTSYLYGFHAFASDISHGYTQSFEGANMPAGFSQGDNSAAAWGLSTEQASTGSMSLKSGNINDSQVSDVALTANFTTFGKLNFDLYTDTETCCDYLRVYVDGTRILDKTLSTRQWQRFSVFVPQGQHTVTWSYYKDGSASTPVDAIYIDNLKFEKEAAFSQHPYSFLRLAKRYNSRGQEISFTSGEVINTGRANSDCASTNTGDIEYLLDGRLAYICPYNHSVMIYNPKFANVEQEFSDVSWFPSNDIIAASATHIYFYETHSSVIKSIRLADGVITDLFNIAHAVDISYVSGSNSLWVLKSPPSNLPTATRINATTGDIEDTITIGEEINYLNNIALTATNNGFLLIASRFGTLRLFDYEEKEELDVIQLGSRTYNSIIDIDTISLNTFLIAEGADNSTVKILNNRLVVIATNEVNSEYTGFIATRKLAQDTDSDGLSDLWEEFFETNKNDASDASLDPDADGLTNLQESQHFTYPNNADTDGDNLSDGAEVNTYGTSPLEVDSDHDGLDDDAEVILYGSNPLSIDSDNDGLSDYDEVNVYLSSPTLADTDGDGLSDSWEVENGSIVFTHDAAADPDNDGLTNAQEFINNTLPLIADSDADLLSDGDEVTATSNPLIQDTDGDGFLDGVEAQYTFLNILVEDDKSLDQDNDGYSNYQEALAYSDLDNSNEVPNYWEKSASSINFNRHQKTTSLNPSNATLAWTQQLTGGNPQLITYQDRFFSDSQISNKLVESYGRFTGQITEIPRFSFLASETQVVDGMIMRERSFGIYLSSIDGSFKNNIAVSNLRSAELLNDGYVLYRDRNSLNLITKTGVKVWSSTLAESSTKLPTFGVVQQRNLVFVLSAGKVELYSLVNGNKIDEIAFSRKVNNLTVFPETFYKYIVTKAGNLIFNDNEYMFAVNLASKKHLFTKQKSRYDTILTLDSLYVRNNQFIEKISQTTGRSLWSFDVSALGFSNGHAITFTPEYMIVNHGTRQEVHFVNLVDREQVHTLSLASAEIDGETVTNFRPERIELADSTLFILDQNNPSSSLSTILVFDLSSDRDNDGLSDSWERLYGYSANNDDSATDTDSDGLTSLQEYQNDTNPLVDDSDNDGLSDGYEVLTSTSSPLLTDSDNDGLADGNEVNTYGTSPVLVDSDGDGLDDDFELFITATDPNDDDSDDDGMGDGFETEYFLNPNDDSDAVIDSDNDGLTNLAEFTENTNPLNADSDKDGLSDGDEVNSYGTEPLMMDTDQDLIADGKEITEGLNPNLASDAIGDLDGDHYSNLTEVFANSELNNAGSVPQNDHWYKVNGDYQNRRYRAISSDADSTSLVWQLSVPNGLYGSVSNDDSVFLRNDYGSGDTKIYSFDLLSGRANWTVNTGYEEHSSSQGVYLINNKLQFSGRTNDGSYENYFVELASGNGEQLSQIKFNITPNFLYETSDDIYFINSYYLQRFNKTLGNNNLEFSTDRENGDNLVVIGSKLYAFYDGSRGGILFSHDITSKINTSASIIGLSNSGYSENGRVSVDFSEQIYIDLNNELIKYNTSSDTFTRIYQQNNGEDIAGRFVVANNIVVLYGQLSNESYGYKAISTLDGHVLWESDVSVSNSRYHRLAATTDHIFVNDYSSSNDVLYMLDITTGEVVNTINNVDNFSLNRLGLLIVKDHSSDNITAYNLEADHDNDAIPSYFERKYGLDPFADDAWADKDNDGLTNLAEFQQSTSPLNNDTDSDGMDDGWEVAQGLNPNNSTDASLDPDGDTLTNLQEYNLGTNINSIDTDGDGLFDKREVDLGTDPTEADSDNDGLTDHEEVVLTTNPLLNDTDGDGINDGREVDLGLNPLLQDSDSDGVLDGDEEIAQSSPHSKWRGWKVLLLKQ